MTALSTGGFHEIARVEPTLVVVRRLAREFTSVAELDLERVRVASALNAVGRSGRGLLVDSRLAPTSTDTRMAAAFEKLRDELARGFERTAVLVSTKIGVLQAKRLTSTARVTGGVEVFDDEAAALQFLRSRTGSI
jgi:uncharacterized membrane-anchored protein